MNKKITEASLHQSWVHSHEEDTATEMVFRPASYHFPPSRGRKSFTLESGGTLVEKGIGPSDVPQEKQGTWKLINSEELAFYFHDESEPRMLLQIVSLEKNRLVVRRK